MRNRIQRFLRRDGKSRRILTAAAGVLCICLFAVCGFSLARYLLEGQKSAEEARELQQVYRTLEPDGTEIPARGALRTFSVRLPAAGETEETGEPAEGKILNWPDNPDRTVSEAFRRLRKRNRDIVGWLTIPGQADQPVVQRDNTYYLTRDSSGLHNANGALFLEEHISLESRPETYIIFGHNMKTGQMFGSLRLYEDPGYYRQNPVIGFDVLYEEGQYAVFAVADVDTVYGLARYVPFLQMNGMDAAERDECIRSLRRLSVIRTPIEVSAEDQLLLLVTCEGEEDSRRIVAARRLREGEQAESVKKSAKYAVRQKN